MKMILNGGNVGWSYTLSYKVTMTIALTSSVNNRVADCPAGSPESSETLTREATVAFPKGVVV